MKRSMLVPAVLALSAALVAVGCQKKAAETIKIGVQTALTGPLPDYGLAAKNGVELALEDFGTFEMDGTTYQVELVVLDDKAEPTESAVVAQTMVDEGVVGVIGSLTTGATLSAIPSYFENRVPQISG